MKNLKPTNRLANSLGCAVVLLAFQHAQAAPSAAPAANSVQKLRVIVTQDGEVDDRSSMVRFLMYSSDYDMVGIVAADSFFQKRGMVGRELTRSLIAMPRFCRT